MAQEEADLAAHPSPGRVQEEPVIGNQRNSVGVIAPQRTFKQKIEDHPLAYVAVVVVGTATVVAGIMSFFSAQRMSSLEGQHKADVTRLETRLASIDRRFGDKGFLDVRALTVHKDQLSVSPRSSTYFPSDNFYAPTDLADWSYAQSTEGQLINEISGDSSGGILARTLALAPPMHIWRSKTRSVVSGSQAFKAAFPFIAVEKFPIDQFSSILSAAQDDFGVALPKSDADKQVSDLNDIFRGDVAGYVLSSRLFFLYAGAAQDPSLKPQLINVQKVGNTVYAKILVTLLNVGVGGIHYDRYYLQQEFVITSAPPNVYFVNVFLPGGDPSFRADNENLAVNKWLGDFALVID